MAVWTAPKVWVAGEVLSSADFNAQFSENLRYLRESAFVGMIAIGVPPNSLWQYCDGGAINRTSFSEWFAYWGVTWGSGNGSTTVNKPDFRGRAPVGMDNLGGNSANRITDSWADVFGGAGGAEKHTLTVSELASHVHDQAEHTHPSPGGGLLQIWTGSTFGISAGSAQIRTIADVGGTGAAGGENTDPAGGNNAHNNVQPSIAVPWITKVL